MMADQDVGKVVKQRRTGDLHILNKFYQFLYLKCVKCRNVILGIILSFIKSVTVLSAVRHKVN